MQARIRNACLVAAALALAAATTGCSRQANRGRNPEIAKHWLPAAPLFDPQKGTTVIEPPARQARTWAGAPSAIFDDQTGKFYLYYRLRWPRGSGELDRGGECRIAQSEDGIHFTDIWSAKKTEFPTLSLERGALVKTPEGLWRLYIGLVDTADNRWRIDMMEASAPNRFDPKTRKRILSADDVGGEAAKDPYVWLIGGTTYMYISYGTKPQALPKGARAGLHALGDVFVTGKVKSHTGLAVSQDGVHFRWLGEVLSSTSGAWDNYCTRLTSILPTPPFFTAFYDGSRSVKQNYEEIAGMAITFDLQHFQKLTTEGPILRSPEGSGSLRYVDAVVHDGKIFYYYEMARADGSHELRVNVVPGT